MTSFPRKVFCDSKMVTVVKSRTKGTTVHFKGKSKQIGIYQRALLKSLQGTHIPLGYRAEATKLS